MILTGSVVGSSLASDESSYITGIELFVEEASHRSERIAGRDCPRCRQRLVDSKQARPQPTAFAFFSPHAQKTDVGLQTDAAQCPPMQRDVRGNDSSTDNGLTPAQ